MINYSEADGGRIVTFYSFKGGVGRSFALANVASLLAIWGFRVLCIDWDLEAPGLHYYFANRTNPPHLWRPYYRDPPQLSDDLNSRGLVHLLGEIAAGDAPSWRDYVVHSRMEGTLDLLPSGSFDPEYASLLSHFDWDRFYSRFGLGDTLERWKSEWKQEYDFVLLDSRTGVTDVGSICTAQLPDLLCIVLTANNQSLDGAVDVAKRAIAARRRLPIDAPDYPVLPIVSRFDEREEYDRAQIWKRIILDRVSIFYESWAADDSSIKKIFDYLFIPYVSRWTFGEELASLQERSPGPESVTYSLETIAALIASRLSRSDLLVESRDSFVRTIRRAASRRGIFLYDVFLSQPSGRTPASEALAEALEREDLRVFVADRTPGEYPPGAGRVRDAITSSQHMVTLVGHNFGPIQEQETVEFLRQSLDERSDRLIFPVLTDEGAIDALPNILRRYQLMSLKSQPVREVAARIARLVRRPRLQPQ